jgi:epoxide hydrolase-like predicted phosphatase
MIKVVTLDLDGVFFLRPHEDFARNYAKKFNLDEEFIKDVLFNRSELEGGYRDLKLGKPSDYWNWEFKTLGIAGKITKAERMGILLDGYKINEQVVELIDKLHAKGIKVASVTNRYEDNTNYLEKRFHFKKYFDILVLSHEVGLLKPDPEIFKILIQKSGVKPEEIVYSDDDPKKIRGATELGINTFIFKDYEQFLGELRELKVI